jgi:muramidase (phage lysozyme)
MLRHIFVFSPDFVDEIASKTLSQESPSPQITAGDVDSSVNNCALICALLIGIPAGLVGNMVYKWETQICTRT